MKYELHACSNMIFILLKKENKTKKNEMFQDAYKSTKHYNHSFEKKDYLIIIIRITLKILIFLNDLWQFLHLRLPKLLTVCLSFI